MFGLSGISIWIYILMIINAYVLRFILYLLWVLSDQYHPHHSGFFTALSIDTMSSLKPQQRTRKWVKGSIPRVQIATAPRWRSAKLSIQAHSPPPNAASCPLWHVRPVRKISWESVHPIRFTVMLHKQESSHPAHGNNWKQSCILVVIRNISKMSQIVARVLYPIYHKNSWRSVSWFLLCC